MVGSTRNLNSLCLVGKPMLLINTRLHLNFRHHRCGCGDSDADLCFACAIFGQDCSLVEVWHYFQQLTIHSNVGTDVVSVVLNDIGPFYVDSHAVCAGPCSQWVVRSCSSLLLPPSDLCHVQNGGCRRASQQLK